MSSGSISEYIESRQIVGAFRERLTGLGQQESSVVESLISVLRPSANTLRDILDAAVEIAARDDRSWIDLLADPSIETVLSDESLSRKERQKHLRALLDALRFPLRVRIQHLLSDCQRSLKTDPGLRVDYPLDLEGDRLSVSVSARSEEEFLQAAKKLEALARDPKTARMFALLRGEDIPEERG